MDWKSICQNHVNAAVVVLEVSKGLRFSAQLSSELSFRLEHWHALLRGGVRCQAFIVGELDSHDMSWAEWEELGYDAKSAQETFAMGLDIGLPAFQPQHVVAIFQGKSGPLPESRATWWPISWGHPFASALHLGGLKKAIFIYGYRILWYVKICLKMIRWKTRFLPDLCDLLAVSWFVVLTICLFVCNSAPRAARRWVAG